VQNVLLGLLAIGDATLLYLRTNLLPIIDDDDGIINKPYIRTNPKTLKATVFVWLDLPFTKTTARTLAAKAQASNMALFDIFSI
jgi:hypothetical protein